MTNGTKSENGQNWPMDVSPAGRLVPAQMRRRIVATIPIKHDLYLHSCARIRGISLTALLTRLVDLIGQDQLVASVLDDADERSGARANINMHPRDVLQPVKI